MATAYSGWVATDDWRIILEYSTSNTSSTVTKVSATVKIESVYATTASSGKATLTIGGSQVASTTSGTYTPGKTTTQCSGSKDITRTSSAQTIAIKATCSIPNSSIAAYKTGTSVTANVTVPAKANTATKPNTPTVTAKRNSDTSITISWNNTASSGGVTGNIVQASVNGGDYTQVSTGVKTSYTYTASAANGRYRFRVNASNSAGTSDWGYSARVCTTPAAPSAVSSRLIYYNSSAMELHISISKTNTKYPSSKIDWQYSNDNSTWRGSSGTANAVYSATTSSLQIPIASMDTTLKSYAQALAGGTGKLYIRARVYNEDNTLSSSFVSSTAALTKQPTVYMYSTGSSISGIYVNSNISQLYINV